MDSSPRRCLLHLSLVFKGRVDVLAAVADSLVVVRPYELNPAFFIVDEHFRYAGLVTQVMDGFVLVLVGIPNPRAKRRRA